MRTKTYSLAGQTVAAANVAAAQAMTAGTALTLTATPFVFGTQKTFTGFGGLTIPSSRAASDRSTSAGF